MKGDNMENNTKDIIVRTDNSEIVPYTIKNIPMYAARERISHYPNMTSIMHWHDDLEFIRVLTGKMIYMVNEQRIELDEGDIIFVNTQQSHGHTHINYQDCIFDGILIPTKLLKYPCELNDKYVHPFYYDSKFASFVFRKDDRGHKALSDACDVIMATVEKKVDAYEFDLVAEAYKLMAEIIKRLNCRAVEAIGVTPWADTLHKMIGYIQSHYKEQISLEDIAGAGIVSRSQCCRIFKEIMNKTPNDYLVEYRINKSIDLLADSNKKITDVAYYCGFNGSSYFSETFKKVMGVTPRQYRKRLHDNN